MAKPAKTSDKNKAKHKAKSVVLYNEAQAGRKNWPIPGTGVVIRIKESQQIDNNLHLWLEAKKQNVDLVHDDHFIFVNPPLIHNGEANPRKALEAIVTGAVLNHMGHKL